MSVALLRGILRGWSSGESNWDTGGMDENLQFIGNHLGFVVRAVDHTVGAPANPSSLVANPVEGDAVIHVPSGAYAVWSTGKKLQSAAWKTYGGRQGVMGFQSVGTGFMIWACSGGAWLDMTATGFVNQQLLAIALQSYLKRDGTTPMTAELPLSGNATQPNSAVTLAQVQGLITDLIDGAPSVLDKLSEVSAALNNDPQFGAHVVQQIAAANANANDRVSMVATAPQTMVSDLNNPDHLFRDAKRNQWLVPSSGSNTSGFKLILDVEKVRFGSSGIFAVYGEGPPNNVFHAIFAWECSSEFGSLRQISGSSYGTYFALKMYVTQGLGRVRIFANANTASIDIPLEVSVIQLTGGRADPVNAVFLEAAVTVGYTLADTLTTTSQGSMGGATQVIHNATLTGDGTAASPLGVVAPPVVQQTWQDRTTARWTRGVTYTNNSVLTRAIWTNFTISGQAVLGWFTGTVGGINVDNNNGAPMTNRIFTLAPGASVAFAIWDGGGGAVDGGCKWMEYDV